MLQTEDPFKDFFSQLSGSELGRLEHLGAGGDYTACMSLSICLVYLLSPTRQLQGNQTFSTNTQGLVGINPNGERPERNLLAMSNSIISTTFSLLQVHQYAGPFLGSEKLDSSFCEKNVQKRNADEF